MLQGKRNMRAHFGLLCTLALLLSAASGLQSFDAAVPRKLLDAGVMPHTLGAMTPIGVHKARELQSLIGSTLVAVGGVVNVVIQAAVDIQASVCLAIGNLAGIKVDAALDLDLGSGVYANYLCTNGHDSQGGNIGSPFPANKDDCMKSCTKEDGCHQAICYTDGTCQKRSQWGSDGKTGPSSSVATSCNRKDFLVTANAKVNNAVEVDVIVNVGGAANCRSYCNGHHMCDCYTLTSDDSCHILSIGLGVKADIVVDLLGGYKESGLKEKHHHCQKGYNIPGAAITAAVAVGSATACRYQAMQTPGCSASTYDGKVCNLLMQHGGSGGLVADVSIVEMCLWGPFLAAEVEATGKVTDYLPILGGSYKCCGDKSSSSCKPAGVPANELSAYVQASVKAKVVTLLEVFFDVRGIVAVRVTLDGGLVQIIGDGRVIGTAGITRQVLDLSAKIGVTLADFRVYVDAKLGIIARILINLSDKTIFDCHPAGVDVTAYVEVPIALQVGAFVGLGGHWGYPSISNCGPYSYLLNVIVLIA